MRLTDREKCFIEENLSMSSRKIAKALWGSPIRKSTINNYRQKLGEVEKLCSNPAKILFVDVECSPSITATFPRYKANISPAQVMQEPYLLTYAGAWLKDEVVFSDRIDRFDTFLTDKSDDFLLTVALRDLLDSADIVVAHNAKFDKGWINARCAYHNIDPPSPYKLICTLKEIKKHFTLPANSLDAACKYFGLPRKVQHQGVKLWMDCVQGLTSAFEEMESYNRGDIPTLIALYKKVRPFMTNHPNVSLYTDNENLRCTTCGSHNVRMTEDKSYTGVNSYNVYVCTDCKASFRSRKGNKTTAQLANIGASC